MFLNKYAIAYLTAILVSVAAPNAVHASDTIKIRVAGWNMESGDSSSSFLKSQIGKKIGIDIWGFSEVAGNSALNDFEIGAGIGESGSFESILGRSGGSDRLAIIYNSDRLELVESSEIEGNDPNLFRRHRKPLTATFRGKTTGQKFKFMVNHLARGDARARKAQAEFLNDWASNQNDPIIAVGDFNFDYHVDLGDSGKRDAAFDEMVEGNTWIWLKPNQLTKTQASDRYNSVLDFVFVANPLDGWSAKSVILRRDGDEPAPYGDFDDSNKMTDHRPVDATFEFSLEDRVADRREDEQDDAEVSNTARLVALEEKLQELEGEIASIRADIGSLINSD